MTNNSMKGPKVGRHLNTMKNHMNLVERLRKSLYYGSINCGSHERIDYPSMPLTEVTVELFDKTVTSGPKGLDVFDMTFASQVTRQACISPTSIMLAMIYLERLKAKNPEYLRRVSTCDLFLVSIMIASKFLFDDGEEDEVFNDEWAVSADIDVKQLNRLEREFLIAINWSLFVDCETFLNQLSKVEALISVNESNKRKSSGMTYTELLALFEYSMSRRKDNDLLWKSFVRSISKILLVSCVAYSATLLALIASTTIARTSFENTPTLVNQSLVSNDSFVLYGNGLYQMPTKLTSDDMAFSYGIKKDKIENIVFIVNPFKRTENIKKIVSKPNVLNLCLDSTPKKYSLNFQKHQYI